MRFNCLNYSKRYAKHRLVVNYSLKLGVFNKENAANYLVKLLVKNSNFAIMKGNGTS
jgi:hypothetical protein